MIIRIHETDFDGNPVRCTGEYLHGETAHDIVSAMALNPFAADLSIADFMRNLLEGIGADSSLPMDEHEAADVFLNRLIRLGYASMDDGISPPDKQHGFQEKQMK